MVVVSKTWEKIKIWEKNNNNIILSKEDNTVFDIVNESITDLIDSKGGNESTYPIILRDRLHLVPFHVRITHPEFAELVKSNMMNDNDRLACYHKWCTQDIILLKIEQIWMLI